MQNLAVLGGSPVRDKPFPTWPPSSHAAAKALVDTVWEGIWSDANGPRKTALEQQFAERQDARFGIAVSNGTVSLQIALAALGVGSGDEVIVPAYTFLATATAVLAVNALPVFVDVDERTACIDPEAVEAAITSRTKAIIPVHLGGHPADLDSLESIAKRYDLPIVEDAAQAHGASWRGRGVGSQGAFGSFSFQASKNLSAGEGGLLTTSEESLANTAWSIHHCGRPREGAWYEHTILGGNYRMTEFQAALLLVQLQSADADLARRERNAAELDSTFAEIDGITPMTRDPRCTHHAYHLYQVKYDAQQFSNVPRERFVEALNAEGIPASLGYGVPLDQQPVFSKLAFDTKATRYDPEYRPTQYGQHTLPAAKKLCEQAVWIPQNVLLGSDSDIAQVISAVKKIRDAAATLGTE